MVSTTNATSGGHAAGDARHFLVAQFAGGMAIEQSFLEGRLIIRARKPEAFRRRELQDVGEPLFLAREMDGFDLRSQRLVALRLLNELLGSFDAIGLRCG